VWNVVLLDEVEEWFLALVKGDAEEVTAVTAAIDLLAEHGPALGRPLADSIKGSRIHNMKELRPSGTSIRVLFVFDPERQAVLLVAGDKAGNWQGWYLAGLYKENIPVAEGRYDGWLAGGYEEEI
jgi:hypothetical protein